MEEVEGKQNQSVLFLHNGFIYHKDKRYRGMTFRCKDRQTAGCKGQALNTAGREIVMIAAHNHGPDHDAATLYGVKSQLLDLAKTSHGSLREVFNDVCRG